MELNREQIKKALECCCGDIVECQKCAYVKNGYNRCKERASQDALALITTQEQKIEELDKDKNKLEYTLAGVMHSVDKWLDGEELEQDEVNRAITMRDKTLRLCEELDCMIDNLRDDIDELTSALTKKETEYNELYELTEDELKEQVKFLEDMRKESD